MDKRGPFVCLCGSTRFKTEFERAEREEALAGHIVLTVGFCEHADGVALAPDDSERLAHLHDQKIRWADEVLVIDVAGYVGDASRREIETARISGKPIRYWSLEHAVAE